jgi:hypothetical protein
LIHGYSGRELEERWLGRGSYRAKWGELEQKLRDFAHTLARSGELQAAGVSELF